MAIFAIEASEVEDFEKWKKEHDKQIRAEEREKLINSLLYECGGSAYESDCELCTFAIYEDNTRVGCKLMEQIK